ncbi:SIR2 family protein [Rhodoferax sp.]|uniref:SIR2 family protein n=1 Tax=Rhodoferax sp. TaxID=50421 RepID=UPI0028471DD8|nr:SIR2 family protein [Rhodoferax sp.]MDR3368173.1 SIR2 family protein [Rhodoferax sp.]
MHKFKNIPDYSAIKKLAAALHRFGANQHGAAIMIGAGFSRSAARHVGGDRKMPLWNAFSEKLLAELNPRDKDLSFSDPLRVAEEYRAYFGQAALNDQIRAQIDNDAWEPGDLYKSLLKLPWSEVMTTNWDTLLERAAKPIHGPYFTSVTRPSDLAWAPSPRIVKLHGTIGVTDTFIAAQEDFRTYPEKFAPFVNFARQVFIENELCLLGFSGEDPNFLQWAGWVRDHLANHARKIYLVGALNLSAPQRVYLESINIAPVDLWDAVKEIQDRDLRHQTAITWFLEAMHEEGATKARPHEWHPSSLHRQQVTSQDHTRTFKDHEYAAQLLKGQLEALQKDRESYPGWLVCPPELRWQVQSQLNDPHPNPNNIAALAPDDRAKLLYEIAWRHGITFDYIHPWLAEALFQVASQEEQCVLSKRQQMEIALILLKSSRWLDESKETGKKAVEEYVQNLTRLLERFAQYLPDCTAELAYHQALIARDSLDYVGMEALVESIQGEDPVWKLRQAALLMELGRFDEGEHSIRDAYRELRERYRYSQDSISTLSRLTWAHFLLKAATQFQTDKTIEAVPPIAKNWKCDPWTWIEDIKEKANKKQEAHLKDQNPIEPLFEQGHYRDNSSSRTYSNQTSEYLLLEGLTREVGIPLRSGSSFMQVNLLTVPAEKLALSGGAGADLRDYTLAIRAASSESSSSIKDVFTRVGVACGSKEVVEALVDRILGAIGYWRKQRSQGTADQKNAALSALRVLMEVLARLVVRVSPAKAKEVFRLALSIGHQSDARHHWLFDALGNLLTYSLSSIPTSEQGDLLADTLEFPLESEVTSGDFPRWPNPIVEYPNARSAYSNLANRINQLINAVANIASQSRASVLQRLLPLVKKENFLTQDERAGLAVALWGSAPDYQTLPETGLFPHALLLLPAPDESRVESLVRQYLYGRSNDVLIDTQKELRRFPSPEIEQAVTVYAGMANAAANIKTHLLPTSEQALALFDQLVAWRPKKEENDFLGSATRDRKQLIDSIGKALSYAIVPALPNEAKNLERFEQLKSFAEEIDEAFSVIPALIYFVKIDEKIALVIEKCIQKSMQDRDARKVAYAAIAIEKWCDFSNAEQPQLLRLVSRLIVIIESGRTVGLQQLILLAEKLLKTQCLSDEQVATLIEATPNAFAAANYTNIDPRSREAISASSIREACVKLAIALLSVRPDTASLQELLKESKEDALPEVRFSSDPNEL